MPGSPAAASATSSRILCRLGTSTAHIRSSIPAASCCRIKSRAHRRTNDMADERQRIDELVNRGLLDQWYAVAKSVQVKPGKPHAVKALGRNLVLWRDAGGKLKCLEDHC